MEFEDDEGSVAWDAIVREDEPMGGATGLTQGLVGPFPHHARERMSQGLRETCSSADLSQEPTEAGHATGASDPLEQRESSKCSCFEGME